MPSGAGAGAGRGAGTGEPRGPEAGAGTGELRRGVTAGGSLTGTGTSRGSGTDTQSGGSLKRTGAAGTRGSATAAGWSGSRTGTGTLTGAGRQTAGTTAQGRTPGQSDQTPMATPCRLPMAKRQTAARSQRCDRSGAFLSAAGACLCRGVQVPECKCMWVIAAAVPGRAAEEAKGGGGS